MEEFQQKKPSFFLIMFVFFLIISIIIVTAIYIKSSKNKLNDLLFGKKEEEVNVTQNITYCMLELKTDAQREVDYKLYEEDVEIVNDKIIPDVDFLYSKAIYNKTYVFEARKEMDYYYNKKKCQVLNDTICFLELKQIGNYSLSFSNSILYVNQVKEGSFQSPLLCVSWTFDIYLVEVRAYEKAQIPKRLRHLADVCYNINEDITQSTEFSINVIRVNPKVSHISFFLLDKDANSDGVLTYEEDRGFPDLTLEVDV